MKHLLLISGLVLAFTFGTMAQAQTTKKANTQTENSQNVKPGTFIDNDKDGVCDNYQIRNAQGTRNGRNFVDANADGICDNATTFKNGNRPNGKGKRCGQGFRHRHGWNQTDTLKTK
ncbi:MAG: hypothetical protein Q7J34_03720 [Bacteroidales bacterium]|nr:hypothetical protein [Bacteroidales bacterium]